MILNPSISVGLFTGPVGSAFVSSFGPAAEPACVDAFAGPLPDRQLSVLANSGSSGGGKRSDSDLKAQDHATSGGTLLLFRYYKSAIVHFDKAISLNAENVPFYLFRAEAQAELECWPEAIADFDHAIRLDPGRAQSYASRGFAKARFGAFAEALADIDRATAIDPSVARKYAVEIANVRRWKESPVLAFMDFGLAKMKEKRFGEAVADFDRALALDPNQTQARLNRGIAKGRLRRFPEAVADFDEILRIDPHLAEAYGHRGGVKACLGDFDAAIADFERAIQLDPSLRKALDREIASVRSRKGG